MMLMATPEALKGAAWVTTHPSKSRNRNLRVLRLDPAAY